MQHLDVSGNLYRFLCSLGALIMGLALTAPLLFARSISTLTLTQDEISKLTPRARETVLGRQDLIANVQDRLIWYVAVTFLIGLGVFLTGVVKWWDRQRGADQDEDRQWATNKARFVEVSDAEATEKLETEAEEDTQPESASTETSVPSPSPRMPLAERREFLRGLEDRVADLAVQAFAGRMEVRRNVRMPGSNPIFDVLLDPPEDSSYGQLAIEVRTSASHQLLTYRMWEVMFRMAVATRDLKRGTVPGFTRGRPRSAQTTSLVILLAEDSSSLGTARPRVVEREAVGNEALRRPVGVVLLGTDELTAMSVDEFRVMVTSKWADPGLAN